MHFTVYLVLGTLVAFLLKGLLLTDPDYVAVAVVMFLILACLGVTAAMKDQRSIRKLKKQLKE